MWPAKISFSLITAVKNLNYTPFQMPLTQRWLPYFQWIKMTHWLYEISEKSSVQFGHFIVRGFFLLLVFANRQKEGVSRLSHRVHCSKGKTLPYQSSSIIFIAVLCIMKRWPHPRVFHLQYSHRSFSFVQLRSRSGGRVPSRSMSDLPRISRQCRTAMPSPSPRSWYRIIRRGTALQS